ncbi:MAG: pseudouridine synthase [Marinobacter sp.]|uniref:pseudouridine synthase n=1 Tax=Marinobacter sp. TaxID=50741 RepID=UPI0034A000BE
MRLDYYLANATAMSRKDAKRAISRGQVCIDGQPCRQIALHIVTGQHITLRGQLLSLPGERYLMLNKPLGVVSATSDRDHLTVLSLLPADQRSHLHVAGRLDIDTTGLVLLTTDGQWSHRLTSPKVECEKIYRVELAAPLRSEAADAIEAGLQLHNEVRKTRPARVVPVAENVIELAITEGRYHQVKRMMAAVGNHVVGLHRLQIGGIRLDPTLEPGESRPLTEEEIQSVD